MFENVLLQINTGHRRAAAYDLQYRTSQLRRFVCLIQEPWVVKGSAGGLDSQHNKIMADCGDKINARAMIYSHRALPVSEHAEFTGRDVASAIWDVGLPNLARVMLISLGMGVMIFCRPSFWSALSGAERRRSLSTLAGTSTPTAPSGVGSRTLEGGI